MTNLVIETQQLCKSFRGQPALRGLDLQVPAGSIFGFLRRNGAGKTTTIKTLMGLLRADSGSTLVFGVPVTDSDSAAQIRRRIGFVTLLAGKKWGRQESTVEREDLAEDSQKRVGATINRSET